MPTPPTSQPGRPRWRRIVQLACWCMLVWVLLTWTRTLEQLTVGAAVSLLVAVLMAPLGDVVAPWSLLRPRRLAALLGLAGTALAKIVVANISLAIRVWRPSRPLRSGMVIVPTDQRSAAGLTIVGLVSSLIVDNQLVDVDRAGGRLQYHAVDVPDRDPDRARAATNGPIEHFLPPDPARERHASKDAM